MSGAGDGRKRLSGFLYKQQREIKQKKLDEILKKTPKIDSFLVPSIQKSSTPTVAEVDSSNAIQCDNAVESCDVENTNTTKDKEPDSEFNDVVESCGVEIENENTTKEPDFNLTEKTDENVTGDPIQKLITEDENPENDFYVGFDRSDPMTWNFTDENKEKQIDQLLSAPIKQDLNADFTKSARAYKLCGKIIFRHATRNMFFSELPNGEKTLRDWLLYSKSVGKMFCVPCKIFGVGDIPIDLTHEGFNYWKNSEKNLSSHERSHNHRKNTFAYIQRLSKLMSIDKDLKSQFEKEKLYWKSILQRLIHVIKYLASRGLPFRGHNENLDSVQNGNYLGLIELLAEYDEFLKNHLEKYGNPGKGYTSYLSHGICDELIHLIGEKVRSTIIDEINQAKYYTLILDSTPDCAHVDQLTVVFRFINVEGDPVERFVTFIPIRSHKAMSMEATIIDFLEKSGIQLDKCRGQCYDNANNMSGIYNGLQALIKRQNKFADHIPCAAHSLNLVGSSAAESCKAANDYFTFLQSLYNFFSGTSSRWASLMDCIKEANANLRLKDDHFVTIKNLSKTRWAARYDASSALLKGYKLIVNCLDEISQDNLQNQTTRDEAKSLHQKLSDNKIAFMIVFWTTVLDQMNRVSKNLQDVSMNLATAVELYQSMKNYFSSMRETRFEEFLEKSEELTGEKWIEWNEREMKKRKPKRKYQFDEKKEETTFTALQSLQIESFNVILDVLISALDKREKGYVTIYSRFGFLFKLTEIDDDEIRKCANDLSSYYSDDLNTGIAEECFHFREYIKLKEAELKSGTIATKMLKEIQSKNLISIFPNIYVALKIFVTLPISNASGERSFSALKRVKDYLRSTTVEEKLTNFAVMAIEPQITKKVSVNEIVDEFADKKSRRKTF